MQIKSNFKFLHSAFYNIDIQEYESSIILE